MAHQNHRRGQERNDSARRQQQNQDQNDRNQQSFTGQTGGQWGEDYHDTPYNSAGGYINTQTNYDQGNYDYSQPDDYGFARGNQYGEDRVSNERNYGNHRQQSSYPSDAFSGRDMGEQGAGQAYGQSFGEHRNAAYDAGEYRSSGRQNEERRGQQREDYGQPTYGGSGQNSRSEQPGFDHGRQHQNSRGYYYDNQGGQPNLNNQTSYGSSAGAHRGKGPKGYKRTDERIIEDVNYHLTDDPHIDASDIEVSVQDGDVTLQGYVENRFAKRHAEDLAERISGVKNVENRLRVKGDGQRANQQGSEQGAGESVTQKASQPDAVTTRKKNKGGA